MNIKSGKREFIPIIVTLALGLLFAILVPRFGSVGNYLSILKRASFLGILAIGMLFVLICGEINLSLSSQHTFTGIICATFMVRFNLPIIITIVLTLFVSVVIGIFNGWFIAKFNSNSMITTMATAICFKGISYTISRGAPILGLPKDFVRISNIKLGQVNIAIIVMAVMAILAIFILKSTYYGKHFYAIGTSEDAARRSGVNVGRTKIIAFALCGFFVGVTGILYLARVGVGQLAISSDMELNILTAAGLAGVGFKGGKGRVVAIVAAVVALELLDAGLIALNANTYFQNIIKGIILLSVLTREFSEEK